MRPAKKTHEQLIEALLSSETVSAAAEKAGMSRQHLYRLLRDPDFQRALRQARSVVHAHAMSRLCALSSKAVSVLESALNDGGVSKTRFLAAKAVLELASEVVTTDIEVRLTEIEQAVLQFLEGGRHARTPRSKTG